jgi:hypothetical protein
MRIVFLLSIIIILPPATISCNLPDSEGKSVSSSYIQAQYAGNLGLISVGYGRFFFNKKLTVGFCYGILPGFLNGSRVNTLALKPAIHYKEFNLSGKKINCYLGISVNYAIASNTYLKYPDYYIEGYYKSNAIHFNPFAGAGISFPMHSRIFDNLILYSELGTIDYQIWYAIKNSEVSFAEIWNLGFGLTFQLKYPQCTRFSPGRP